MNSATTDRFRRALVHLPHPIREKARKAYRLWLRDPQHPSLHFKKVGTLWSVRVDDGYRALGLVRNGTMYWVWIGTHDDYERMIRR